MKYELIIRSCAEKDIADAINSEKVDSFISLKNNF